MPEFRATINVLCTDEWPPQAEHRAMTLLTQARQLEAGVRFESISVHKLMDVEVEVLQLRDRLHTLLNENHDLKRRVSDLSKPERVARRKGRSAGAARRVGIYEQNGYWICRFCDAQSRELQSLEHYPYCRGGER